MPRATGIWVDLLEADTPVGPSAHSLLLIARILCGFAALCFAAPRIEPSMLMGAAIGTSITAALLVRCGYFSQRQ